MIFIWIQGLDCFCVHHAILWPCILELDYILRPHLISIGILNLKMIQFWPSYRHTKYSCTDKLTSLHCTLLPVSLWFCHHNSNLMGIWFCSHPNPNKVIAAKFCTWHNSSAVVSCANICCDVMARHGIAVKWIFAWILIEMEKSLVKLAPELWWHMSMRGLVPGHLQPPIWVTSRAN